MKILISKIEEATGKKVRKNMKCAGFDIATRTGICCISVGKEYVTLEWQFVEFDKASTKAKYKSMVTAFEEIISPELKKAIIEDTHLQYFRNPVTKRLCPQVAVLKQLTTYGAFAISKCIREDVTYDKIGVTKSRANFGIKTQKGKTKESVAKWLKDNLDIDLGGDTDCSDAVVLALNGVMK